MIKTVCPSFPQVKMFMKLCFPHNSVISQPISLTFGVICSWKIGASNGTNSPVHNWLQLVFYWLLFMSGLCATDPDPEQPDLKSGLLRSIFAVQFSLVASPYDQTVKHYTQLIAGISDCGINNKSVETKACHKLINDNPLSESWAYGH
jgi:hypothetical protein